MIGSIPGPLPTRNPVETFTPASAAQNSPHRMQSLVRTSLRLETEAPRPVSPSGEISTREPRIPQPMVEAHGLRKSFETTLAVADVTFSVPEGEIFGLVGPDGAGKTTAFRLLLGLLKPDAGSSRLGGFDAARQPREARSQVGYVTQAFTLYSDLTVEENIRFTAGVRSMRPDEWRPRAEALLELTALSPFTGRLARDLSGGMKRKLGLICALLHRPRILLLDEPTTGLDPVSRREFWRMLYALPSEGVTLVVSTPYLDEAERCHRLGFMAAGRLLALDTPQGLLRRMPDALVEIHTPVRTQARRVLQKHPHVRRVEVVGGALRVAFDRSVGELRGGEALVEWLREQGTEVDSWSPVEPGLPDVFSSLSSGTGAEG